jgi:hypothetical protein
MHGGGLADPSRLRKPAVDWRIRVGWGSWRIRVG